jgi:hypothetical protein
LISEPSVVSDIDQRNVFGGNIVARVAGESSGERWAFAKGVLAAVIAGLILHFVFGIG